MANLDNANPAVTQSLSEMTHGFMQQWYGQADSYTLAMSYLGSQFNRQVSLFSYSEAFKLLAICFLGCAVIISVCYWLQQKDKKGRDRRCLGERAKHRASGRSSGAQGRPGRPLPCQPGRAARITICLIPAGVRRGRVRV